MAPQLEADFDLVARNFEQAAATYERAALVQNAMGAELISVMRRVLAEQEGKDLSSSSWQQVLEIGCGPGNFTHMLLESVKGIDNLSLNDLSPLLVESALKRVAAPAKALGCNLQGLVGNLAGDTKLLLPRCDLMISNATLQWFYDLDEALTKLKHYAKPQSLLVYSSFLEGTMKELTELLGHSLNYLTAAEAEATLARHCEVMHFCTKTVVQHFDSSFHLLRHFKDTGVNSLKSEPLNAGKLRQLMLRYEQRYSDDSGAIPLTWQPYFVVARWR